MLWLWCRLAAVAPIRPLAWELPCAMGAALKKRGKKSLALTAHQAACQKGFGVKNMRK